MSKNLFKKGLAFGAVLSLGVTGFTGVSAANAAAGDNLALAPATGTGYNVFLQDTLNVKATVNEVAVNANFNDDVAWKLSSLSGATGVTLTADQFDVAFTEDGTSSGTDRCEIVISYKAYAVNTGAETSGKLVVDSEAFLDPDGGSALTTDDATVARCVTQLTNGTDSNLANAAVDLAWDSAAIDSIVITPGAYKLHASNEDVEAVSTSDARKDLQISVVDADNDYADGDVSLSIVSWIETDADYSTVDSGVSKSEVVNFYDPKNVSVSSQLKRVTAADQYVATTGVLSLNPDNASSISGTLKFGKTVNFDQITWSEWEYSIDSTETGEDIAATAIDVRANTSEAFLTSNNFEVLTPAGGSATNKSKTGEVSFRAAVDTGNLLKGETYRIGFSHTEDTANVEYVSTGFQVLDKTSSVGGSGATLVSTTDAKLTTETVAVRTGTKAVSYKTQIISGDVDNTSSGVDINGDGAKTVADDYAAYAAENIPVLAVVTAGSYFATGDKISVSGTTDTIAVAGGSVITSALTDSKGQWTVTVTSDLAKTGASYTVNFYVLLTDGTWAKVRTSTDNDALYTATYESTAPSTVTADSTVLSGANPAVAFTVKDQFGQPTSVSADGKALNVSLIAPDKTKLEKYLPVTAGVASFTFANYLAAGASDVLTAKVYTGTSTSPTQVGSLTLPVTLYNSNAVAGVNVAAEVTSVVVTYDDFITGASSSTNVAPDDNSFTYTGTVVDANGAGVPGAPVTIAGKGFQFAKTGTTTYFVDSITVAASEAGTFSVTAYTHVASAAGNLITATSGAKSGSTKVKSAVPATLSTKNLAFSWALPTNPVKNTTYAVVATVTDKWGNGISGASVKFSGFAAAQFNAAADVTRTTDKNGKATAYLRTLKDVDGIAAVGAELLGTGLTFTSNEGLAAVYTDSTATKWDESTWSATLEKSLNFFAGKLSATITKAATSSAVVKNASGATVKIVRGTKSATKVATSNSYKVTLKGGTGTVKVYVNGVKVASK